MKDSHLNYEQKSMFSVNTLMTLQQQGISKNDLHKYFFQLMPQHSQQYQYLSKIFFMQLVLKQNIIIYSDRRIALKDIWMSISIKLGFTTPNIYVIDKNTDYNQLFRAKGDHNLRYMLMDMHNTSTKGLNYIMNQLASQTTILAIEPQNAQLSQQLSSMFSLCFRDAKQESFDTFLQKLHEKTEDIKFNRLQFHQCLQMNLEYVNRVQQQQGFLKIYLKILKYKLNGKGLNFANSKWKKALKNLLFFGATKIQNTFKKFTLTDCLLVPNLLSSNIKQVQIILKQNQQALFALIPFYGSYKFMKNLKDHFWLQQQTKKYYLSLAQKMSTHVSFFYPCTKFPQTVSIAYDQTDTFYRINGYDKKLMSDKYYDIKHNKRYKLKIIFRTSSKMIIHIGIACFDENKNIIHPIQVCRKENSDVLVEYIEGNKLIVQNQQNLKNWNQNESKEEYFAYERCIGVYKEGQISLVLPIQNIVFDQPQAYNKSIDRGAYSYIQKNCIYLSPIGQKWFNNRTNKIKNGKTVVMNHYEGGTYIINKSLNEHFENWKQQEMTFQEFKRENSGKSFFQSTKYIRVIIMSNYNNGFPNYQISNKQASMDIKQIKWYELP